MKMLVISITTVTLAVLLGILVISHPGAYVIGGEYTVQKGEVLRGDLNAVFAQVTLKDGAQVDGKIFSLSSTVDIGGAVAGGILSIGSDVRVRQTARLSDSPREMEGLPYIILLPEMGRMGSRPAQ